jgi:hypothetical protein
VRLCAEATPGGIITCSSAAETFEERKKQRPAASETNNFFCFCFSVESGVFFLLTFHNYVRGEA